MTINSLIWKKDDVKFVGISFQNVIYIHIKDMVQYAKNATIKFHNKALPPLIMGLFEIKSYNKAYIF
jgi:hypothetical protein